MVHSTFPAGSTGRGLGITPTPLGYVELDALSYGNDPIDEPFQNGDIYHVFSVDEFAIGLPGSAVRVEGALGNMEASADTFIQVKTDFPTPPILGDNRAFTDGDGVTPSGAPGVGLIEPNPATVGSYVPPAGPAIDARDPGDNLDAVDFDTTLEEVAAGPIYFSLDSNFADPLETALGAPGPNTGTALANGFVGGDVIVNPAPGAPNVLYASAAALGLDLLGADTDDLDALKLWENGIDGYQASVVPFDWVGGATDMLLYSVRRNSAIIGTLDSIFGIPIEEGDILTTPCPAGTVLPDGTVCAGGPAPGIFTAAEWLGLATVRSGTGASWGVINPQYGQDVWADNLDAYDQVAAGARLAHPARPGAGRIRDRVSRERAHPRDNTRRSEEVHSQPVDGRGSSGYPPSAGPQRATVNARQSGARPRAPASFRYPPARGRSWGSPSARTAPARTTTGTSRSRASGSPPASSTSRRVTPGRRQYFQYGGWLNGYLSATNRYESRTFDVVSWQTTGVLAGWLARFCERNPRRRSCVPWRRWSMRSARAAGDAGAAVAVTVGEITVLSTGPRYSACRSGSWSRATTPARQPVSSTTRPGPRSRPFKRSRASTRRGCRTGHPRETFPVMAASLDSLAREGRPGLTITGWWRLRGRNRPSTIPGSAVLWTDRALSSNAGLPRARSSHGHAQSIDGGPYDLGAPRPRTGPIKSRLVRLHLTQALTGRRRSGTTGKAGRPTRGQVSKSDTDGQVAGRIARRSLIAMGRVVLRWAKCHFSRLDPCPTA